MTRCFKLNEEYLINIDAKWPTMFHFLLAIVGVVSTAINSQLVSVTTSKHIHQHSSLTTDGLLQLTRKKDEEMDCFVSRYCEHRIAVETTLCNVSDYMVCTYVIY